MQSSKVDGMMYVGDLDDHMMVKGTDPEEIRLQAWLAGSYDADKVPEQGQAIRVGWFRCNPCFCGEHGFHVDPVHGYRQLRGAWLGAEVRMVPRENVFPDLETRFWGQSVRVSTQWRYGIKIWRLRP